MYVNLILKIKKFKITGDQDNGINITISREHYIPGDINSIRDCITNINSKIERLEEIITGSSDELGVIQCIFELSFKREDGTIIDTIEIDDSENFELTNRIMTTFCLV